LRKKEVSEKLDRKGESARKIITMPVSKKETNHQPPHQKTNNRSKILPVKFPSSHNEPGQTES